MAAMGVSLFILWKKSSLLQGVIKPIAFIPCWFTLNQGRTTSGESMMLFPLFVSRKDAVFVIPEAQGNECRRCRNQRILYGALQLAYI